MWPSDPGRGQRFLDEFGAGSVFDSFDVDLEEWSPATPSFIAEGAVALGALRLFVSLQYYDGQSVLDLTLMSPCCGADLETDWDVSSCSSCDRGYDRVRPEYISLIDYAQTKDRWVAWTPASPQIEAWMTWAEPDSEPLARALSSGSVTEALQNLFTSLMSGLHA